MTRVRGGLIFLTMVLVCAPLFSVRPVSAATPVTFSQTINPLVCTVDIIEAGADSVSIVLSPSKCMQSPDARELLATTRTQLQP